MPCSLHRVRDGDTIEVQLAASRMKLALRLIDCWCPELNTPLGKKAYMVAREVILSFPEPFYYHIPLDSQDIWEASVLGRPLNFGDLWSFDRIPAYLWLDEKTTLNREMVKRNLASTKKGGLLGS